MSYAIETQGLVRCFGSLRAVDGLDLQVPKQSVFGFLGPNGSGKTTTIRLLLGLIRPDRGSVFLNGHKLRDDRTRALASVGAMVETPALYPNLTATETLRMAALLGEWPATEIERVLEIVDLVGARNQRVRTYSLGMRQRLAIARALMGSPELLILDEPTNGLDPAGIAEMRALIQNLPERSGTTVFLSSHLLSEIEQMSDHCALIRTGRLLYQGPLNDLMAQAPREFVLDVDDPTQALSVARDLGFKAEDNAGTIRIDASLQAEDRASLIAAMVGAGVSVSGAVQRQASLEALFLSLTADEGAEP